MSRGMSASADATTIAAAAAYCAEEIPIAVPSGPAISAPAGKYSVTLKFAELYWTAKGGRVFNVAINGTTVLSNFDIFFHCGVTPAPN